MLLVDKVTQILTFGLPCIGLILITIFVISLLLHKSEPITKVKNKN